MKTIREMHRDPDVIEMLKNLSEWNRCLRAEKNQYRRRYSRSQPLLSKQIKYYAMSLGSIVLLVYESLS